MYDELTKVDIEKMEEEIKLLLIPADPQDAKNAINYLKKNIA